MSLVSTKMGDDLVTTGAISNLRLVCGGVHMV